ncbi:CHAD domain-containing protein [Defluviimonas sp. WL0024]|uniref:CHAD domain-containing protein n=2 Tax=Albidovulum TaxID=205889 RepID=A0ABT3J988_9RHOB|nr:MULTISPECIES: CHAD domain-containing protein [Defluviimonas]MCU9849849.1 CHAD domain-containing protein [Defluviimonas sp. WL0024]MCW3784251.1 CHAD domain-containing protein [Defluviimonas salinarum]
MAFAFELADRNAAKAVRRIVRDRLAASSALIADRSLPPAELVHELRKNIKKSRAALRLVRPGLKAFGRENDALREAARLMEPLRDADVLSQTFDRIAAKLHLPQATQIRLREALAAPQGDAPDTEAVYAAHAEAINEIAARAKGWKAHGSGFDALSGGLERSWEDARDALEKAASSPTPERLHRWRRRVKDHWYHARLLAPVWPEMMHPHVMAADTLGEMLGDVRDLATLIEALAGIEGGDEVCAQAAREEARLRTDAFALGLRFFREPAHGLSRRWRGWWEIWTDRSGQSSE